MKFLNENELPSTRGSRAIIRRRGFWISLVASLLLVGPMIAGLASTTPAVAAADTTISLANNAGWCINVENHDNVVNQPVWLWNCSTGQDLEWVYSGDKTCSAFTGMNNCFQFADAQDTKLCLGAPAGTDQPLLLLACGGDRALWYNNGSTLASGAYGVGETIAVDAPIENGSVIYAMPHPPPAGWWWNWSWSA
jgi:hypothetical protein